MAFLGSMFGGIMSGVEKGYKFGGEIIKDLRLQELLDKTKDEGKGGDYGSSGESTGTSAPTGAATPYTAGGDKPSQGAPYVQEKPAPPPPGMDAFARKGKPIPPGMEPQKQEYQPPVPGRDDDPATAIPTGTSTWLDRNFPGMKGNTPGILKPPSIPQSGKYPWFVPDSWVNPKQTNPDGTSYTGPIIGQPTAQPQLGDMQNGHVLTGKGWVPAPAGAVTPGQALPVPP